MRYQREANEGRLLAKPSPASTAESQSMLVDELLEKCRELQKQEDQQEIDSVASSIQHESPLDESAMDAGQLAFNRDQYAKSSQQSEQNNLQCIVERVLRKSTGKIVEQVYRRLVDRTSKKLQGQQRKTKEQVAEEDVEGEIGASLLEDIQRRLASLIKYACLSEESAWQELDNEDVASYLVLSEVSLKSEVEKKKLMYVSNYLFDRLSQHRAQLKELTKQHVEAHDKWKEEKKKLYNELRAARSKDSGCSKDSIVEQRDRIKERLHQLSNRDIENQKRLTILAERFEGVMKDLDLTKNQLLKCESEREKMNQAVSSLRAQIQNSKEVIQSLTIRHVKDAERTRQLQSNNKLLQQLLKGANEERDRGRSQRERIQREIEQKQLQERIAMLRATVQQLQRDNAQLERANRMQKEQLDTAQAQRIALQSLIVKRQQQKEILVGNLASAHQLNQQLKQAAQNLTRDLRAAKSQHEQSILQHSKRTTESRQQLNRAQQSLTELQNRNRISESQLTSKLQLIVELQRISCEAQTAASETAKRHEHIVMQLQEQAEAARQQNQQLAILLESAQTRLAMAEHRTTLDREELSRSHKQIEMLKQLNLEFRNQISLFEHSSNKQAVSQNEEATRSLHDELGRMREELLAMRKSENDLRAELVEQKQRLNTTSDQLHQTRQRLEETESALSRSQQCVDQLHSGLQARNETVEKNPPSVGSDGIERQVVINFLLNMLNSELPLNQRINTIRTMAKALRMKPEELSAVLRHSERSFMQFELRNEPKPPEKKINASIQEKLYDFFQQSEQDD